MIPLGALTRKTVQGGSGLRHVHTYTDSAVIGTWNQTIPLGPDFPGRTVLLVALHRATQPAHTSTVEINAVPATRDIGKDPNFSYPIAGIWRAYPDGEETALTVAAAGPYNLNGLWLGVYVSGPVGLVDAQRSANTGTCTVNTQGGGFVLGGLASGRLSDQPVTSLSANAPDWSTEEMGMHAFGHIPQALGQPVTISATPGSTTMTVAASYAPL